MNDQRQDEPRQQRRRSSASSWHRRQRRRSTDFSGLSDSIGGLLSRMSRRSSGDYSSTGRTPFENYWSIVSVSSDSPVADRKQINNLWDVITIWALVHWRSCRRTCRVAAAYPRVLLETFVTFALISAAGLTVVLLFAKKYEDDFQNDVVKKAEMMGRRVRIELDKALQPLFTMEEIVHGIDTFYDLPFKTSAAPIFTTTSGRVFRNVTGICNDPFYTEPYADFAASIKDSARMPKILVNVQLAPFGVVCLLHPLINTDDFPEGIIMDNRGAIGLELLNDPINGYYTREAIKDDRVTIQGPLTLVQGNEPVVKEALIARNPIYVNGHSLFIDEVDYHFWGFSTILLNWQQLKEKVGLYGFFAENDMEFILSRTDTLIDFETNEEYEREVVIAQSEAASVDFTEEDSIAVPLGITDNDWVLTVQCCASPRWRAWASAGVVVGSFLLSIAFMVVLVAKKEHELLLYSMMPRGVINRLRRGETVLEKYDLATICYFDIVSFTEISGKMKPVEVMSMLKELYREFDKIARKFQVFNVETIGDAYIVIGGGPEKCSGREGAEKVALFAYEAIESIKVLQFENMANVSIRAGMASGLVIAGVVGTTLPKYTLFGNTVTLAARLEASAQSMRILCSDTTSRLLRDSPCYEFGLEERCNDRKDHSQRAWWITAVNQREGNILNKVSHDNHSFEEGHPGKDLNCRSDEGKCALQRSSLSLKSLGGSSVQSDCVSISKPSDTSCRVTVEVEEPCISSKDSNTFKNDSTRSLVRTGSSGFRRRLSYSRSPSASSLNDPPVVRSGSVRKMGPRRSSLLSVGSLSVNEPSEESDFGEHSSLMGLRRSSLLSEDDSITMADKPPNKEALNKRLESSKSSIFSVSSISLDGKANKAALSSSAEIIFEGSRDSLLSLGEQTTDVESIYSKESSAFHNYWSKLAAENSAWKVDEGASDSNPPVINCWEAFLLDASSQWHSFKRKCRTAAGHRQIILVTIITFAVFCSVGLAVVLVAAGDYEDDRRTDLMNKAEDADNFISDDLAKALLPLHAMSELVKNLNIFFDLPLKIINTTTFSKGARVFRNVTGICDDSHYTETYSRVAASIKKSADMPEVLINVQLAPHGVVCLVHPLKNKEDFPEGLQLDSSGARGHDLVNDPVNGYYTKEAIKDNRVTIQGPLTLIQGDEAVVDEALIARSPIRLDGHSLVIDNVDYDFWGFTTVLLNWQKLKEKVGLYEFFAQHGMEFILTRTDTLLDIEANEEYKRVVVIAESEGSRVLSNKNSVSVPLQASDNDWVLVVGYETGLSPAWTIWACICVAGGALLVSLALMLVLVTTKDHELLLYRMMPRTAVRKLQRGETVIESTGLATIFFSHIIGFKTMAGIMNAQNFMTLLNYIYDEFDKLAVQHHVTKIESIGDAYIVTANDQLDGKLGAEKVALFALDAMKFVKDFRYEGMRVFARAGLASGPMVSGVIGAAVPKYTIFGDTVNLASRMESTSTSMNIQCSGATFQLLKESPGSEFLLEVRRDNNEDGIFVKGKGFVKTWWIKDAKKRSEQLKGDEGKSEPSEDEVDVSKNQTRIVSNACRNKPLATSLEDTQDLSEPLEDVGGDIARNQKQRESSQRWDRNQLAASGRRNSRRVSWHQDVDDAIEEGLSKRNSGGSENDMGS